MKLLKAFKDAYEKLGSYDKDTGTYNNEVKHLDKATRSYNINCTGDACVGDEVLFIRDIFTGGRNAKFSHYEIQTGTILKDSYGEDKQQHTFTLINDNKKYIIKGRNLYRNGTWRKKWADEDKRLEVLNEKHIRGSYARCARRERIKEYTF